MRHNGRTDKVIFRGYLEVKNKNEVSKSKFAGNKAKLDAIKKNSYEQVQRHILLAQTKSVT